MPTCNQHVYTHLLYVAYTHTSESLCKLSSEPRVKHWLSLMIPLSVYGYVCVCVCTVLYLCVFVYA